MDNGDTLTKLNEERSLLRRRLAEIEAALPDDEASSVAYSRDERWLQAMFESSHQLAAVLTLDGGIVDENRTVLDALGHPMRRTGLIWSELPEWVAPEDSAAARAALAEARGGRRAEFVGQIRGPRGETLTIATSVRPVLDRHGRPHALLAEGRDVTAERRAAAALAASEAELHGILGEIEDVVCSFALDRPHFHYISPSASRVLGVSADELMRRGGRMLEMVPPEELPRFAAFRERVWRDGAGEIFYRFLRGDGAERHQRMRVHLVRGPDGEPLRGDALISDVTEQRRAEEALAQQDRRYRSLIDQGWDVISLVGADGKTFYVSESVRRVRGFTPAEVIATPIAAQLHPEDAPQLLSALAALLATPGAVETTEMRVSHRDGRWIWLETVSANRLEDPDVRALVISARDITARKEAQEEILASHDALARSAAELERRVVERTAELSLANAALERAARAKDEFLASMSHELRTPLNAVLGLCEAIDEGVYGPVTEAQRRALGRMSDSGRHLLELIGDILDLSKIEAGRMALDVAPVSAGDVCRGSMALIQEAAQRKRQTVSLQIDDGFLTLPADERRLKQVLVNLLSNAVKFTPEGGSVRLLVSADEGGETVCFRVEDSGPGISEEDQARLFQPFVQLDSSLSRAHAGTGLGLSLVRRLVELHGGSVSLESELGQGSRFAVVLPRRRASTAAPAPGGPRALIVEDSQPVAEQIARYVREAGLVPVIHDRSEGVVERAAAEQPQVILLDILLPAETGWEVLRELKADRRTAHIPVVVVSVLDRPEQGAALGASGYVVKPVSRERLFAALRAVTGEAGAERPVLIVAPTVEPAARNRRILLAEDDEVNVATLIDFLRSRSHEVFVARNGEEAVRLARELTPDLILMDVQMPVMDGLQAIRTLRADPAHAATPIVAVTALAMTGDRDRCLAAGANEYLPKPVGLKKLATLIARLLPAR